MLMPFTTAPTNTVLRYLERTPIGLANMFRREDGEFAFKDPAARNRIMARVSLSTGVMYTMHNLAMEGHFTGAMPADETQRRKLPPGWQPYSFVMKANGWPKDSDGDDLPLTYTFYYLAASATAATPLGAVTVSSTKKCPTYQKMSDRWRQNACERIRHHGLILRDACEIQCISLDT